MKTFKSHLRRFAGTVGVAVLATLPSAAQTGPPAAPTQGSIVNQLPLSGQTQLNGGVTSVQVPVAATTASVNTLNTSVQATGSFTGSVDGISKSPFSGPLSFTDAIHRGLDFNLGTAALSQLIRQAQGQTRVARSALLPNLDATASETVQQLNLRAAGVRVNSPLPGLAIPAIVGPFNYFDLRAHLTQTIGDVVSLKNYRSAQELVRSNEFSLKDARDLVVLAVGGAYLQVAAAKQRVVSEQAQLNTASALYKQASDQRGVGLIAQIDVNRSRIQMLTENERLATLRNDLSKQKINLARMIGLPANERFDISDSIAFASFPVLDLEATLKEAYETREDLKAAQSQVRAAQLSLSASRAERYPSLSVNADYGVIGINPNQSHGTFSAGATLTVPIWRGGRTEGDIQQADAALVQRRSEVENIHSRIEGDVRSAYLDIEVAANQVTVAQENLKVSRENLDLTRQKFQAGVSDNVEVVQAQQTVASAELDLINSVLAHNVAKLSLARAIGDSADSLTRFLKLP
jgi:outer membrane protein TolC